MSIGVAIPCYYGHINNLTNLLDSIENQSVKPNKVVVSSSSTKELFETKKYSFPLEIIITEQHKNAAQNRNIAASRLNDMDYITFMDADDIMHPQRIEILLKVFQDTDCDIVLHNYFMNEQKFEKIDNIDLRINTLVQAYWGAIIHKEDKYNYVEHIHHSQVSIKRNIFDIIKFPEELIIGEDALFCHRIFGLPNIKNVYIKNELSFYSPSKSFLNKL
jgi:glycosyltransferase involved in cell wall biosynthesis